MKKVMLAVGGVLLLLMAAVVAIPFLFKDQINNTIKAEINKNVNAKVDYADFDLTLLHSFPNLTFTLSDFSVAGKDEFKGDTLLSVNEFKVTLDIMTVIRKEKYKILELLLEQPRVRAIVTRQGKSNWDIMKKTAGSSSSSSSSDFALQIKKYGIEHGWIVYNDDQTGTFASLIDLNFSGSGDVGKDVYEFLTKTSIEGVTYRQGAVSYLNNARITANNDVTVNSSESKYSFSKNEIAVNDLAVQFDGFVQQKKDALALDVQFKSARSEFKSILSLIPAIYKKDFDKIKTGGTLQLAGIVKGQYTETQLPECHIKLQVADAMFQYPSLPVAVSRINIAGTIDKPQGVADLTVIDLPSCKLVIGADPVDIALHVSSPVSDPNVTARINGRMNLANVPKLYPMEGVKKLEGVLNANVNFKGRMSDVQKKNYNAIQAAGTVNVAQMTYDSKETAMPVVVPNLSLTFNPKNVTVNNLDARIGKSDFHATGAVDNFLGYAFGKGDLEGTLNLNGHLLDANEFLKDDTKATSSKEPGAQQKYFEVPKHISFSAATHFDQILFNKMQLNNVAGTATIKNEAIDLKGLSAQLLGGSALITANYSTLTGLPHVNFSYDIRNFDFQKTHAAVDMATKLAPVMKYVTGNFSSNLSGTCRMNSDMTVDYNSLNAAGKVQIPTAQISGLPIIDKIGEVTKLAAFRNPTITNAWTALKVHDGRVDVEPTDFKFGNGYLINVAGSNGFDQSIDYTARFDVPTKEFGSGATQLVGMIPKIPGMDIKMPETLNLYLGIGGTVTKPTVKLAKVGGGASGKGLVQDAADQLKKKAEEEAKKQVDAVKQKAQEEADKLRQEAEQRARDAADKAAKDAADQLKNATKGLKWPW
ncbi:MAG: AsmA-like C-terminal region-containing protein [Chitinophagales bacterium]